MKVYVVTYGEYSDYTIEGVTLDKEVAEEYVKKYNTASDSYSEARVEIYNTDNFERMTKMPMYKCLGKWGEIEKTEEIEFNYKDIYKNGEVEELRGDKYDFCIAVYAKDADHATKAASEIMESYMNRKGIIAR